MKENKPLPIVFEYYSAIHLTNIYKRPFWVWKDVCPLKKKYSNFPVRDKGIDISDETFTFLGQSKYYSEKTQITYGKLSTFLATKVLVGKNDITFNLIRTSHSKIEPTLIPMIKRKDLIDIPLDNQKFLCDIKDIIKNY
jgi:hypothetical protein